MRSKKQDKTGSYNVSNLTRGLDMMELLLKHPAGLGVSDISRELAIPLNAAFRIASALAERGYLLKDEEAKVFILSSRLMSMGYRMGDRHGLVETAMPLMRELRDEVGEPVVLCIRDKENALVLDFVPGHHMFQFVVVPGAKVPYHASAPGKALLAFLPEAEKKARLAGLKLTRFNDQTITTKAALEKELDKTKKQGYAEDHSEEREGVRCVAAPIFDRRGYPVAVITLTGPSDRVTEGGLATLGEKIKVCAACISSRLGV